MSYKIQVTEALRLKKEISEYFKNIQYKVNYPTNLYAGQTFIDSVEQTDLSLNKLDIRIALEHFSELMKLSEEINDALSNFNRINKIDSLIRTKANYEALLKGYSGAGEVSSPYQKDSVVVAASGDKVKTTKEYKPFMTEIQLKEKTLTLKKEVREIQNKVDKLNLKTIELSFDFDTFENFKIV